MKRILSILTFLVLFFCCTNPSSKESGLNSDGVIDADKTIIVEAEKSQEGKKIKEETNKLVIHNVQQIINRRLEQHQCDEFTNAINKKGVYKHADGTIHEILWSEDSYLD